MTDETGTAQPAVDVYWRPDCVFCIHLRLYLLWKRIPARWHNIWADDSAAAFVRSVALGNETVPTVVVGGRSYVNPPPSWIAELLRKDRG